MPAGGQQQPARRQLAKERAQRRAGRGRAGVAAKAAAVVTAVEAAEAQGHGPPTAGEREQGKFDKDKEWVYSVTSQGRGELLDGDEEKELTLMVQDLLKLEAIATELKGSLGRTPTDQEWMEGVGMVDERRFAARVHQGRKAKTMMVQSNLRLVVSICKKYTGYGLSLQDLVAEGIAGLLKGVERFEPTKGFKFSTYAHWWIRQSITRGLSDQGRMVRLPVHMHELLQKVMKAQRSLSEVYGRKPRMEEVSAHLGVEIERIQEMYEVMRDTSSLDQPMMDGDGAATLGDTVEDEDALTPEDKVMMDNLQGDLEAVLQQLNPREAGVLRMRFGLVDGEEKTLDEIGKTFNVTRERIRQIEARAIRMLRAKQAQLDSISDHAEGKKSRLAARSAGAAIKKKNS